MNGCYCSAWDGDTAEVSHLTTPRARKEYRCDECKEPIRIGERYERLFMVLDGDPITFRTCSECVDLRAYLNSLTDGDDFVCYGSLGCAYVEHLRELAASEKAA